ncbi:hypothetical protein [Weizmannia phage Youna2]
MVEVKEKRQTWEEYVEESRMTTVAEWVLELWHTKEKLKASQNRLERAYLQERIKDLHRIIKRKKAELGIK